VEMAVEAMTQYNISQIPIVKNGTFVGSLNDNSLFAQLLENPDLKTVAVEKVMDPPFPMVAGSATIEEIAPKLDKNTNALLVDLGSEEVHIVTKHDVLGAIQ